jgi:tRNA(Arg) A34 adenosine deaminase TadA
MTGVHVTRRQTLIMGGSSLCCAQTVRAEMAPKARNCVDVTAPPALFLTPFEEEGHGIFLRLAMALVYDRWSVDRSRPDLMAAYAAAEPGRRFPDVKGHHVGALVVDARSRIISFALNRNVALNSTLEHAEARAIRSAIHIANDSAEGGPKRWSYSELLRDCRLYSTLEPCAQCAGIMDIANFGWAFYGQEDPSQNHVVNVLYNLQRDPLSTGAPMPVAASFIPYWNQLADAYQRFQDAPTKGSTGVTWFLSSVEAYAIFRQAARDFETLTARHPENEKTVTDARAFRARWRNPPEHDLVPN